MNKQPIPDDEPENLEALSAIKIFSLFEKAVHKINTYPLTKKNITVQQDAYKRLAVTEADEAGDDGTYEIFATLLCNQKEKDTDLRFGIEFAAAGASLTIESVGSFFLGFGRVGVEDPFKDEADALKYIIDALHMLANGQLACLLTLHNGRWCATELLLYGPDTRIPTVIGTEANFPRRIKSDSEGYETILLRNDYVSSQLPLPKEMLLARRRPDGTLPLKGRVFETPVLTPLTKEVHNFVMGELLLRSTGKKDDESIWNTLYRSWETWVFLASVIALYSIGIEKGFLPHFIVYVPVVTWPVTLFLMILLLIPLLRKKEALRLRQPGHVWFMLDNAIHGLGRLLIRQTTAAIATVLVISTWWPIYFLPNTLQPANLYDLSLSPLMMYSLPLLFAAAGVASFVRNMKGVVASTVLMWGGVALAFAVNGTTNVVEGTPEPYTTITILAYFLALIVSAVILWRKIKQARLVRKQAAALSKKEKLQQKLRTFRSVTLSTCYVAVALLATAAFLFKDSLVPASIVYGEPLVVWMGILGVAGVLGIMTLGFQLKRIHQKEFVWIVFTLCIGLLVGFAYSIESGAEQQGSNGAWGLLFLGTLSPVAVLLTVQSIINLPKHEALKAKALGKSQKQPPAKTT